MWPYLQFTGEVILRGALPNIIFLFIVAFLPIGVKMRNFSQQLKADSDKLLYEGSLVVIGTILVLIAMFSSGWGRTFAIGGYIGFVFLWSSLRRKGFLWRKVILVTTLSDGSEEEKVVRRWGVFGGAISDLAIVGSSSACALVMIELLFQAASKTNQTSSMVWAYMSGQDPVGVAQKAINDAGASVLFAHFLFSLLFNIGRFVWESVCENKGDWVHGGAGWFYTRGPMVILILIAFWGNIVAYLVAMLLTPFVFFLYTKRWPKTKEDRFEFADLHGEGHIVVALIIIICGLGSLNTAPETYGQHATAVRQTLTSGQFVQPAGGEDATETVKPTAVPEVTPTR